MVHRKKLKYIQQQYHIKILNGIIKVLIIDSKHDKHIIDSSLAILIKIIQARKFVSIQIDIADFIIIDLIIIHEFVQAFTLIFNIQFQCHHCFFFAYYLFCKLIGKINFCFILLLTIVFDFKQSMIFYSFCSNSLMLVLGIRDVIDICSAFD